MKLKEYKLRLHQLSTEELIVELNTIEQELFNLKLNVRAGQVKNHAQLKKLRCNVARVKTILHAHTLARV